MEVYKNISYENCSVGDKLCWDELAKSGVPSTSALLAHTGEQDRTSIWSSDAYALWKRPVTLKLPKDQ